MTGILSTTLGATGASGSNGGYDPRALDALKRDAKVGADAASTRKVAQQFESMFLSMMLKNMRASLPNSDPLASDASKMATDMYDQQLAQNIASRGRGIGLADALIAQIERSQGKAPKTHAPSTTTTTGGVAASLSHVIDRARTTVKAAGATIEAALGLDGSAAATPASTGNVHRDFVDRFKDAAMAAAEASGLPMKILLGQAALESGWGKREVRDAQGTGSYNLFGIKAGAGWTGPTVDAITTEVVNGVAQKVVQKFRAYASYAESFTDYAKLVTGNPRYEKAVQASDDVHKFAKEMGRSGYATDPSYGSKLVSVLTGPLSKWL